MHNRNITELLISIVVIALALLIIYYRHAPTTKKAEKKVEVQEPHIGTTEMLTVRVDNKKPIQIGIIGESNGAKTSGEAFNAVIVEHLLQVLKRHHVQAVFATGNLVSARNSSGKSDNWLLNQQIQDFYTLYKSVLKDVPFFPAMGSLEAAAATTSQKFRDNFRLGKGMAFDPQAFAYTVSIGKAFFAVIPTNITNLQSGEVEQTFSEKMLNWLDTTLKEASKTHSFLFVVGHEPAFLPTVTFPDKQTPQRDAFWQILIDNGVTAYFSSHEQLFDRTNRQGVWQIVSGGGGAPYSEGRRDQPFFHCLLLIIPAETDKFPSVQVLDENGNIRDEFDLTSESPLIRQLHISKAA